MSARRHKQAPKASAKAVSVDKLADGSTSSGGNPRLPVFLGLLLVLATVAVYWPVTGFQFINYDDHDYVTENYHVLAGLTWGGVKWAFTTGAAANWHPVTWLSHMLDVQMFGSQAGGHHFTNLLFHVANTVLLFILLRKLTGAIWRAALVAALFALHPLHVESVAWVSERKDVLSTFFGLLALVCYANYTQSNRDRIPKAKEFYGLALIFFALSLMSKPMLVTLPFLLLLLDYWPLQRVSGFEFQVSSWKTLLMEKIPFLALSAGSCVITFLVQRAGGAVQTLARIPLSMRLENALVSYARYLGKTFWPVNLANPYPQSGAWPLGWVLLAASLVAGVCVAAVRLRRTRPYVFVGWFWFLGMLVPVIGLVQVGVQSMADRYTYVPLTGIFIMVVWAAAEVMERVVALRQCFYGAGILILLACAGRTADQIRYWHDSGSVSRHAIAVTKANDVAYSNLGNYLMECGQVDEAITNYMRALQCARGSGAVEVRVKATDTSGPGNEFFKINPARIAAGATVLNNLGIAWAKKGQADEAMQYYHAALDVNPNNAQARYNLAHEFAVRKQYDEAIKYFEAAVAAAPDDIEIRDVFGNTLMEVGRTNDAIQQYETSLRVAPNDAQAHNYLGLALAAQGRWDEAISHYEAALRADPKLIEVHNNLGSALVSLGRLDEAIGHFRQLLQVMPEHPRAQDNLGVALASKGQLDEAVIHLREAIRLQPDNARTHFNLGNVLAMQRDFSAAEKEYREAIRLAPNLAPAHCNLGGVLTELGRRDEAVSQFKEALRLNPGYEPAREQLRLLGVTP